MKITKQILASIVYLSISFVGLAQGIEFREGNWADVKAMAKAENKLIFFDANTSWCGPCKWLAKNTFTDKGVGDFYNQNFISYELDMEKGEGVALADEFKIKAYPTLLFLDGGGNIVHRTAGAMDAEKFLELGRVALDPERNLAGMEQRYKNGERSQEFIRKYLARLSEAGKPLKEILDWYFYPLSEDDLLTKDNFEVISKYVNSPDSPQFRFLMKEGEAYGQIVTAKEVNDKIYNVYQSHLFGAMYSNDSLKWEIAKAEVKSSSMENSDKLLAYVDTYYFSRKKDWKTYVDAVNHYIMTYELDNWESLNRYGWQIYKNTDITDQVSLKLALSWVDHSIQLKNCYANNDTRAALLYKMGDKKRAIKAANQAIAAATADEDTSGTKELIAQMSK